MLVDPNNPDEQLPPSARKSAAAASQSATSEKRKSDGDRPRRSLKGPFLAGAALLAALLLVPLFGGESAHDDWAHHEQATRHFDSEDNGIKWVTQAGPGHFVDSIVLGSDDFDETTTEAFHKAGYDEDARQQIIEDAQQDLVDPDTISDLSDEPARPMLTNGMISGVNAHNARFYHIFLFDSCDEDGDVVNIKINGQRFATVPITNTGTTLSVPLNSGATISVEGVLDGGGGITVACRTSMGEGFIRVLAVGEEQHLATVVGQ